MFLIKESHAYNLREICDVYYSIDMIRTDPNTFIYEYRIVIEDYGRIREIAMPGTIDTESKAKKIFYKIFEYYDKGKKVIYLDDLIEEVLAE